MEERWKSKNIWTIPNLMSLFRLLLIPVILWLYWNGKYKETVAAVALSALTDVLDGRIARRFHMVSDLGKVLDPIADKLTQGAMLICLGVKYPWLWLAIFVFVLKESLMVYWGYCALKLKDQINGAKWYGKATTVLLYAVTLVLLCFPNISMTWANILIFLCIAAIAASMVLYGRFYKKILDTSK